MSKVTFKEKIFNRNYKIYNYYLKSHKAFKKNHKLIGKFYERVIYRKYHCMISGLAEISSGLMLPHPIGIVIGSGVIIGKNCIIYQNVTLGRKSSNSPEYPTVCDNVTIYCNSCIIGGIKLNSNSIVGCNSTVLRDVEENETVFGIVK